MKLFVNETNTKEYDNIKISVIDNHIQISDKNGSIVNASIMIPSRMNLNVVLPIIVNFINFNILDNSVVYWNTLEPNGMKITIDNNSLTITENSIICE